MMRFLHRTGRCTAATFGKRDPPLHSSGDGTANPRPCEYVSKVADRNTICVWWYIWLFEIFLTPKQVYDFELDKTKDITEFLKQLKPALDKKQKRMIDTEVTNVNRSLGTIFGSEITKKYDDTLDEDTFIIKCRRSPEAAVSK